MKPSPLIRAVGRYEPAAGSGAAREAGNSGIGVVAGGSASAGAGNGGASVVSLSEARSSRRETDGHGPETAGHTRVFTVAVEHHFSGVGRYSRLLSVSSAMSVADFADAVLISFHWPEPVNRVPEAHPTSYVAWDDRAVEGGSESLESLESLESPESLKSLESPEASVFSESPDSGSRVETGAGTGAAWSFRARTAGRVRVYAKGANSIGTALGDIFRRGSIGVLKVDGYDFSVTVTDSTARHEELDRHTSNASSGYVESEDSRSFPGLGAPADVAGEPEAEAVLLAADFLADVDEVDEPAEHLHPVGIPALVDVTEVNVALAGEDTVEHILAEVDPELRDLLNEGELYEFIPLLQALDLERPANVAEHAAELLADAPIENKKIRRAAAWARIIALSTLVESEADEVSEAFMAALGYTRADAKLPPTETALGTDPLSAGEIKWLSRRTGRILAQVGACKWEPQPDDQAVPLVPQCSLLERLEMYRFILQH